MGSGDGAESKNESHQRSSSCNRICKQRDCAISAASRSAMMPDPITAATSGLVANISDNTRRDNVWCIASVPEQL